MTEWTSPKSCHHQKGCFCAQSVVGTPQTLSKVRVKAKKSTSTSGRENLHTVRFNLLLFPPSTIILSLRKLSDTKEEIGQSKNKKIKENRKCHNLSQHLGCDLEIEINSRKLEVLNNL